MVFQRSIACNGRRSMQAVWRHPMKVSQRLIFTILALVMVTTMFGGVVLAHHGRSGYGSDDTIVTMEGVVAQVMWRNPHVFVAYDVTDDNGDAVRWMGEFSSVQSMMSEGMSRTGFKTGDEIRVTTLPAASGSPHGLVIKIETLDGSVSVDLSARRGGIRAR